MTDRDHSRAVRWEAQLPSVLVFVVAVGALFRIVLHNGVSYSKADEQVYANQSCTVANHGLGAYPGIVHDYLAGQQDYLYPSPLRWFFVLVNSISSKVLGCGPSSVAWVSTLAGIAMVVLVALMAARYLGMGAAVVATAFVASSPLQLLVGRRALGDELTGVMALAGLWCVLRYCERRSRGRLAALILVLVAACGTKEIVVLLYPALFLPLAITCWRERRVHAGDVLAVVAPPVISATVFSLLAHSVSAYGKVLHDVKRSTTSDYVQMYQHGPPQRILIDLVALAPVVVVLGLIAIGLVLEQRAPEPKLLAAITLLAVVPYALASAKAIRLVIAGDTLLCVLAAWGLCYALRRASPVWIGLVAGTAVLANVLVSVALSRADLYDPVTFNIFRALHMVP